jgi:hypothetical protein
MADLVVRSDFSTWGRFGVRMEGVDPILGRETTTEVRGLVRDGVADAKRRVAKDTRRTEQSIRGRVRTVAGTVVGEIGSPLASAATIEFGRRAGSKMPPRGSLIASGWLRRHGIPDSAEFAVRRAIARRGIRARPFLAPALADVQRRVTPALMAAGERTLQSVVRAA